MAPGRPDPYSPYSIYSMESLDMSDTHKRGWVGVDLDGTLAYYDGWKGVDHIGEPIAPMVERVRRWLDEGHEVRIFTARVARDTGDDLSEVIQTIDEWCFKHLGHVLQITNVKDMAMIELWDDRAVQVVANTGEPVGTSTHGLS